MQTNSTTQKTFKHVKTGLEKLQKIANLAQAFADQIKPDTEEGY